MIKFSDIKDRAQHILNILSTGDEPTDEVVNSFLDISEEELPAAEFEVLMVKTFRATLPEIIEHNLRALSDYRMSVLIATYQMWMMGQGLILGSADDHHFDEALTYEQRQWLIHFSKMWEENVI